GGRRAEPAAGARRWLGAQPRRPLGQAGTARAVRPPGGHRGRGARGRRRPLRRHPGPARARGRGAWPAAPAAGGHPGQHPREEPPVSEALLEARGISKSYGVVRALWEADFDVNAGEVAALVGDNGAGKSTLVKILSGTTAPDAGEIWFEGRQVTIPTPDRKSVVW